MSTPDDILNGPGGYPSAAPRLPTNSGWIDAGTPPEQGRDVIVLLEDGGRHPGRYCAPPGKGFSGTWAYDNCAATIYVDEKMGRVKGWQYPPPDPRDATIATLKDGVEKLAFLLRDAGERLPGNLYQGEIGHAAYWLGVLARLEAP